MTAVSLAGSLADLACRPALLLAAIFAATFVLEDAAIVAAGLLAANALVDPAAAIAVLVAGTAAGDMGLHFAGRHARQWRWVRRQHARPQVARAFEWIERRWWIALLVARFTPGLRLPVYLASGLAGLKPLRCAAVILLAALVWTPALFLASAAGGAALGGHAAPAGLAAVALAAVGGTMFARRSGQLRERTRRTKRVPLAIRRMHCSTLRDMDYLPLAKSGALY